MTHENPVASRRIDRWIESTKWPIAAISAILSPLIVHAIGLWIRRFWDYPIYTVMFALGAIVVIVLCRTPLVRQPFVRELIRLERRSTHFLLSLVALRPLGRILFPRTPPERWLSSGNWLALSSPLFLPLASIFLWFATWFFLPASLRSFIVGFGVAYHIASVAFQWTYGTNELRRLGSRFCMLFLIPANLMVIGTGYAFALNGFHGLAQFMHDVLQPLTLAWQMITSLFGAK